MPAQPSRSRFAIAVLAGTAAGLLVPLLAVVVEFLSPPPRLPDGAPDDGYARMLLLLLAVWPALYLTTAVLHTVLFYLLMRLGLLRWPVAMGLAAALAGAGCLALGAGTLAAMVVAASFAAGALLAWGIAMPGIRASVTTDLGERPQAPLHPR